MELSTSFLSIQTSLGQPQLDRLPNILMALKAIAQSAGLIVWSDMPFIESQRPTYMFKLHLEAMYRSTDHESNLAGTTQSLES